MRLGAQLAAQGLHCVLPWGSEAERRAPRAHRDGDPRRAWCRRAWRWRAGAACSRDARCVVGVDTGLTHLAAALGVPTVGILLRLRSARSPALHAGRMRATSAAPARRPSAARGRSPRCEALA